MDDDGAPVGIAKPRAVTLWSQAPSRLEYPTGRVDIWKVHLDEPPTAADETRVLSVDEVSRADRFHFEKDRIHFVRCRSALRSLLATYLAIPAADILFEYLTNGKPQLAPAQNPHALQFNLSHSGGMALIAMGSDHRLGVDIEKIRGDVDTRSLAERFFSLREREGLQTLPDNLRVAGFFACWTRKESFLKATGDGLCFPLADFSVTTHPNVDPALEEIQGNTDVRKQWLIADLSVDDGYRAAVALDRARSRLETYAWN